MFTSKFFEFKNTQIYEFCINNRFLRESGMASTLKMEYQVFFCIFQKNLAMATLGLKEMGKFLWEGRKKFCPVGCLSLVLLNSFGKCKKNSGIMKSGVDAMPLFHLDHLLNKKTILDFD